jgi:hypothetical protein
MLVQRCSASTSRASATAFSSGLTFQKRRIVSSSGTRPLWVKGTTLATTRRRSHLVDRGSYAVVRQVRVVANVNIAEPWDPSDEFSGEEVVLNRLRALSTQAVTDLCNWTRLLIGQDWMEPPGKYPDLVSTSELLDISDANNIRGYSLVTSGTILVLPEGTICTGDGLAAVDAAMRLRGSPTAEDLLLADAQHLVHYGPGATDSDRAVLLAAIAVEVRIKRTLRAVATASHAPLVELLIANPRDWSLSAHSFFTKAMPAVCQRELGEEFSELGRKVQSLFEDRNKVAHVGSTIAHERATEHVDTAGRALRLLNDLIVERPSNGA